MVDRLAFAAELDQLAADVARIRPMSNRNPHAFYEDRSEVASRIRKAAAKLRNPVTPAAKDDAETPGKPGRIVGRDVIHAGGRTVMVLRRLTTKSIVAT